MAKSMLLLGLVGFAAATITPMWQASGMLDGIKRTQAPGFGPLFSGPADQWIGKPVMGHTHTFRWTSDQSRACRDASNATAVIRYPPQSCGAFAPSSLEWKRCKALNMRCGLPAKANAVVQACTLFLSLLAVFVTLCYSRNVGIARVFAFTAALAGLSSCGLFAAAFYFSSEWATAEAHAAKAAHRVEEVEGNPVLAWGFVANLLASLITVFAARRLGQANSRDYLPLYS